MQRVMLKSNVHRATVTDCDLHYVGSITMDPDLLDAADILEHEQVHVVAELVDERPPELPGPARRLPAADDAAAAAREEAPRRADRHGHGVRLPERARGRGGGRRPGPRRRLGRDDRPRLPEHGGGRARRAARPRPGHAARPAHAVPRRRPAFGSYEVSDEQAVPTALRFVKEAGCDAVKLEGGGAVPVARARAIVGAGIPVMGHVGLTPQTSTALGGYRAQGRTADAAARIAREALALQDAGCFALVFEAMPSAVAAELMVRLDLPVIGIGAGPATDGQVLVFHDLLGIREGLRRALRQALRVAAGGDGRRRSRFRQRRAGAPVPGAGARLLDRGGGARRVPGRAGPELAPFTWR